MKKLIDRALKAAIESSPKEKAIVLYGARQVGKTTLLESIFTNPRARWFSGDNEEDVGMLTALPSQADLQALLSGIEVLIIDEAQRIPSIGLLIKRLVDLKTPCRIVATGSSALTLAGGVMESAAGRTWNLRLWPLSVQEIAHHASWLALEQSMSERLVYGCYPNIVNNPEHAKGTLKDLFDSTVFKDIFSFNMIRKHPNFLKLVQLLAHNIGSTLSIARLATECSMSAVAVSNYLALLEQNYIIRVLPSYSRNMANELKKSKKIYFVDLGIRNAAIGNFTPFSSRTDTERGALWENYFIMERMKFHDYADDDVQLFFWRDKQKHEIDLVERDAAGNLRTFECKLKEQNLKAPSYFRTLYPDCPFDVAAPSNFRRFFTPQA